MSFFGFETSLPRDRRQADEDFGDKTLDPFDPTDQIIDEAQEDAAFEEKLRGLRAAGQEDVEIYTWGGGGDAANGGGEGLDDGLGDLLEEANDDFNEDTFGLDDGPVGKDFDFGNGASQGSAFGSSSAGTGLPAFFDQGSGAGRGAGAQSGRPRRNDDAFAATMDDFFGVPQAKPVSAPFASQTDAFQRQQQQQQQPAASASLADIEASMRAQRLSAAPAQQPVTTAPAAAAPTSRRALTMEEVEAEMRAKRGQSQAAPPPSTTPAAAAVNDAAFPPLGSAPPSQVPQRAPAPIQLPFPPMPNPADPNYQAAMAGRMRAMLETLPNPIQARIVALPPYLHFGATEGVIRDFPALTVANSPEKLPQQVDNPRLWPRIDGTPEEQNTIRFMVDTALAKLNEAHRQEDRRQVRIAKIRAMAPRNNLMSRSDKDFITRIQVSQLITNDPYTDDFYAHIYFALHGDRQKAAPAAAASTVAASKEEGKPTTEEEPTRKRGRQRKGQPNRHETAMLRMQQQVERIVQHRKERIEKAAGSAALEGALGRVTLSTTKAPRQMLQIGQDGSSDDTGKDSPKPSSATLDDSVGKGHAQTAVQEALQGASLAQGGVQRRPALNRFEVLSILEKLYDVVLNLEQLRRTAPADVSEDNADPAAQAWRQERDGLTTLLWKELRVLEPLEISDPHPFVSLLSTVKGKRILPRALRHLSQEQTLTAMTMIVASFDRLDVVRESALLDDPFAMAKPMQAASNERRDDLLRQMDAFSTNIVPTMLSLMTTVPMRIVSGMLALLIERNDPVRIVQSRAGVAFLTIFLSRAASLRQAVPSNGSAVVSEPGAADMIPTAADLAQWNEIFNLLIQRLASPPTQLTTLFPSTRARLRLPFGAPPLDKASKALLEVEDRSVWQLMAAMAVSANMAQQQVLVTGLRDKILENVLEAKQWSMANPLAASTGEGDLRIRNVNLLLHALNLDAAQITV